MKRIGEVIASATTHFMAQALRDPDRGLSMPKAPPFGTFVRAHLEDEDLDVFGLVYHVETTSIDAAHRPLALNLSRQELREQQPQIFELLRTDFSLVVTGYRLDGRVHAGLPPTPPLVHDFVYACDAAEVVALTERLDFLRTLLTFAQAPTDELVAACLRGAYRLRGEDRPFLLGAGRALANLLKNDYDRLNAIMGRLAP
ncbi:MAG: hypothetical protein JWM80_6045 [Cyanobacteria bacterium RYN_339]|nr:hypothetical protein [Cyanobacteria bacterium RYN_339]